MSDITTELAERRTITAHERTLLAVERTLSAWLRTGLASAATGFALVKLMTDSEPRWLIQTLGAVFIAAGGLMIVLGTWSYRASLREIPDTPIRGAPSWIMQALGITLAAGAAAALMLVFK